MLGLVSAAKAGVAVAALPKALGSAEPDLVWVLDIVAERTRAWRMLTHPEACHFPRVEAFLEFIVSEIESLKPISTGRAVRAPSVSPADEHSPARIGQSPSGPFGHAVTRRRASPSLLARS